MHKKKKKEKSTFNNYYNIICGNFISTLQRLHHNTMFFSRSILYNTIFENIIKYPERFRFRAVLVDTLQRKR